MLISVLHFKFCSMIHIKSHINHDINLKVMLLMVNSEGRVQLELEQVTPSEERAVSYLWEQMHLILILLIKIGQADKCSLV